jgi:uncharacterized protein
MTPIRALILLFLLVAAPAAAQNFPKLSGRVVDAADLLTDPEEAALTQKLQALEDKTHRQLVVATVPDLQGYPVEDYGYKLGRAWGIGQKGANNGAILLVAKAEHKIRIEVGYGLEPILTDAYSGEIIRNQITPAFKQGQFAAGINAGVDAIVQQLQAPPQEQEQRVQQASAQQTTRHSQRQSGSFVPLIFWVIILAFVIVPAIGRRRYGRRHRGSAWPVMIWGPGLGGGWGGGSSSGGGWGGFSGGGGGGGFSGGGGSFGGGGASGGW